MGRQAWPRLLTCWAVSWVPCDSLVAACAHVCARKVDEAAA